MKKIIFALLALMLITALGLTFTSCGGDKECTEHVDANGDAKCDDCDAACDPALHEHSDMNADNKCDGCGTELTPPEHVHKDKDQNYVCDECGDRLPKPTHEHTDANDDNVCDDCGKDIPLDLKDLTVIKTSTHDRIRTVHPGESITYTFTVSSTAAVDKVVEILDFLPANLAYVKGDCTKQGDRLLFNLTVPAGEIATASYTVLVSDNDGLYGMTIGTDAPIANGKAIECTSLYVANTLNAYDMQKMVYAIYAMRDSKMQGKDLLAFHSRIAFSLNNAIVDNADALANALFLDSNAENSDKYASIVVPGLYGGKSTGATQAARFVGNAKGSLEIEDIFPGDVLVVLPDDSDLDGARMYVTDGVKLFDITTTTTEVPVSSVVDGISQNDYFALLRPIMSSTSVASFRSEPFYVGVTDVEKAIISTAMAFLLRGDRMQYADTRLVQDPAIYRWERGKSPEDYTVDETGYSNCTGFTHDVIYNALGYDYGSFTLVNSPAAMKAYKYTFTHNETDAEKAAIEEEYRSRLQVGDIVFYTYSGNTHAMIYIGNGNLVHATGSTYSGTTETEEATVRFQNLDCLFTEGDGRYLFQTDKPRTALYIIRPTNTWSGTTVPDISINRIENMQGIVAEKLSSHTLGQTVNPGDLITYTFKIFNANNTSVTLDITDVVPTGTVLLVDGVASADTSLGWTVTLSPGEEKLVSYTVKVSDTATRGSAITCSANSTVGGVPVRSTPVYVGRTLTESEQARLVEIAISMRGSSASAVEIANEIYRQLLGVENALGDDISDLKNGIFTQSGSIYKLAESGDYVEMIAPSHYGGKVVDNSTRFDSERTRMPREHNLVVGDILYLQSSTSGYLYIYIGDGVMLDLQKFTDRDVNERLEETIGWQMFAIIRPSLIAE